MDKFQKLILESYWNIMYARELLDVSPNVIREQCYGCIVDHPSQTNHVCIMLETEELLNTYFESLLERVDERALLDEWKRTVPTTDDTAQIVEEYGRKLSRRPKTERWRSRMLRIMNRL